jgi:hypothetical protein
VLAFIYFISSHPEFLWRVDSLAWRVRAPRRVGLYLFHFQPSRVPLEGGLAHLGESARHGTLVINLFTSSPAFQRSSGRWARSLDESACHGTLAFIYLFSSHPEFLWRVDSLTLASLHATACWPLCTSSPAFQGSPGRWARSLGEPACHGTLAFIYLFSSHPEFLWRVDSLTLASLRATARWPFFLYFIPSLPEILWKVGSLAWRVCAPWHVGFYLLCSQPSRVPLEGGLACLVGLHVAMHWLCYEVVSLYVFIFTCLKNA